VIIGACADYNWKLPGVYRIPIQQGTVIEQSMVYKLKPGMDKDQVRFIMGTPVIVDPFHSNRWDYIYTFKKGSDRVREQRHVTLHFDDNEQLSHISGDIEVVNPDLLAEPETDKQPESYEVPDRPKPGLFGRLLDRPDERVEGEGEAEGRAEENIDIIEESGERGPGGGEY